MENPDPNLVKGYFARLSKAISDVPFAEVAKLAQVIREVSAGGGTIWIAGNGGSAATASHMAVDLSFGVRPLGFVRAISLCENSASLTATGNDVGFNDVFSRQIASGGRSGDLLIVISASGNSPNLLQAVNQAKMSSLRTAAVLGFNGGRLANLVDLPIVTVCDLGDYGIAEDLHLAVNHCLKELLTNDA
jgi:D-sedoheptulose 7-phosphate isomerase